jgi:hypothetical protein
MLVIHSLLRNFRNKISLKMQLTVLGILLFLCRKLVKNKKYEGELLNDLSSPSLRPTRKKIEKFGNFKSLISYLYEYKRINKKQMKLFSYLYVW